MSQPCRIVMLRDLKMGDTVSTPLGRLAAVHGFVGPRMDLRYLDDGDEVALLPHLLTIITRAKDRPVPIAFFSGADAVRERRTI